MTRLLTRRGLRAAGTVLLAFAALLLAGATPSAAATYTLAFTGKVFEVTGGFVGFGIDVDDAVSGKITIDPFNENVSEYESSKQNRFDQANVAFEFHLAHPAGMNFAETGPGAVYSYGQHEWKSLTFNALGTDSALALHFGTYGPGSPLNSLAGLPDTAAGIMAMLANSPTGTEGVFELSGIGRVRFTIDFAPTAVTPVPAALPLFASALIGVGYVGWRRRKAAAAQ